MRAQQRRGKALRGVEAEGSVANVSYRAPERSEPRARAGRKRRRDEAETPKQSGARSGEEQRKRAPLLETASKSAPTAEPKLSGVEQHALSASRTATNNSHEARTKEKRKGRARSPKQKQTRTHQEPTKNPPRTHQEPTQASIGTHPAWWRH